MSLSNPKLLVMFDPTQPVHLYTDWSKKAIASYVAQPDKKQPIVLKYQLLTK
ncbi:hypothetical protein HDU84_001548, partial [Entophlyctis sp. JEL0112]